MPLCCKTKINTTLMCEVLDKDTIKPEILPHLSVAKRGYVSKMTWWKSFYTFSTSQKTGCRWQMTAAFPWYCFRWPWAVCPTTTRVGGRKRTCLPCRCPGACIQYNRFCLVFSKKFNIMSALSVHQPLTLPQKIDFREAWLWCKMGMVVNAGKMNFYSQKPPFAPIWFSKTNVNSRQPSS